MKFGREALYSLLSNRQTFSMHVVIMFWVSVAATEAMMIESTFERSGSLSGVGRRISRIQCAAFCAREKKCSGFSTRDDGVCEFKTDLSAQNNSDQYQRLRMRDVSSIPTLVVLFYTHMRLSPNIFSKNYCM